FALSACSPEGALDPTAEQIDVTLLDGESEDAASTRKLGGATVSGTIVVMVEAKKHGERASFYLDDVDRSGYPYIVDDAAPFTASIDTTELEDGQQDRKSVV